MNLPAAFSTAADGRAEARRFIAQRGSAAVLALCVVVHLAVMILAVRHGISAAEILAHTRGSVAWSSFYGIFVLAVSIHAPLGLRNIAIEWGRWRGKLLDAACGAFGLLLLALGLRAVWAVCWSAA
jgi:fumarate reductase subunit C